MITLKNKYVIGTHVMFFEIEMYKDFIDGLVNLLETVENKDNVTIDLCFNVSEEIEKIDYDKISKDELLGKFYAGVNQIRVLGYEKVNTRIVEEDELDEITVTGDVEGYNTPFAFDPEGKKRKKKYKAS